MLHICANHEMQFKSEAALEDHLKSKAHREYYCKLHDTLFKSNAKLEEHLKSSIHQFQCLDHSLTFQSKIELEIHFKSAHTTFYCKDHLKAFKNANAMASHMCSSAHVKPNPDEIIEDQQVLKKMSLLALNEISDIVLTFTCQKHQKSFKCQRDLDNHLNSMAHLENLSLDKTIKFLRQFSSKGKWVRSEEFSHNGRTLGYFKCLCERWWLSSFSFKKYKQACQKCEMYKLPLFLLEVDSETKKQARKKVNGARGHDKLRCEACKLGLCF